VSGAVILRSEATRNLGISAGQNAEILRSAQDDSREPVAQSFASQKLCGFGEGKDRPSGDGFEKGEVCATLLENFKPLAS
jgi:hypothetical protein